MFGTGAEDDSAPPERRLTRKPALRRRDLKSDRKNDDTKSSASLSSSGWSTFSYTSTTNSVLVFLSDGYFKSYDLSNGDTAAHFVSYMSHAVNLEPDMKGSIAISALKGTTDFLSKEWFAEQPETLEVMATQHISHVIIVF